jgi:hypothetical protein
MAWQPRFQQGFAKVRERAVGACWSVLGAAVRHNSLYLHHLAGMFRA